MHYGTMLRGTHDGDYQADEDHKGPDVSGDVRLRVQPEFGDRVAKPE